MTTDWQVSEVGDTCRPAAEPRSRRSVQIEWISAGTAHLGFPALWSVPHLLSHEIKMNRRHSYRHWMSGLGIADLLWKRTFSWEVVSRRSSQLRSHEARSSALKAWHCHRVSHKIARCASEKSTARSWKRFAEPMASVHQNGDWQESGVGDTCRTVAELGTLRSVSELLHVLLTLSFGRFLVSPLVCAQNDDHQTP